VNQYYSRLKDYFDILWREQAEGFFNIIMEQMRLILKDETYEAK
jgi:hypothetical protein